MFVRTINIVDVFLGYFYVPDTKDESVLAMCSDEDNTLLVTGDTKGVVKVWAIQDYCVKPGERVSSTDSHRTYTLNVLVSTVYSMWIQYTSKLVQNSVHECN